MMPPIRFGMKNTERKMFDPLIALVSMYAMENATTLITIVVTIVSNVEKPSACRNSLSCSARV